MRIAFTSCMDAERVPDQPVWDQIARVAPDALMLLGDNIYMDWGLRAIATVPHWRKRWDKRPADALEAFAEEMHRRYQWQWEVQSFKRLITEFVGRRGSSSLYVIRDEHDFAWNNAVGAGNAQEPKWVPPEIAEKSNFLFEQFRSVLADPVTWKGRYPEITAKLPRVSAPGDQLGPFALVLQDQRSNRVARFVAGTNKTPKAPQERRLLSDADRDTMLRVVRSSTRPVLIVGSSPLRHDYRFSEQGWWSATAQYSEYQQLIEAARTSNRAVLYLGGDIHRLSYDGPIDRSPVVQVLASGAAVGRVLFKKFPEAFAWLEVDSAGSSGTVQIKGSAAGVESTFAALKYEGHAWSNSVPVGGSANGQPTWALSPVDLVNQTPVAVLTVRARGELSLEGNLGVQPEELDAIYGDELAGPPGAAPAFAEAVAVEQLANRLEIGLTRNTEVPCAADAERLIEDAVARAKTSCRAAVVFFIHGFGKSFSESIDQASQLRERFNVEPILFSWPSGENGGWLKEKLEFWDSVVHCKGQAPALLRALQAFGVAATSNRGKGLAFTIVARSLGAHALEEAISATFYQGRDLHKVLADVSRVLLSAPAVELSTHAKWLQGLGEKVVVTINESDSTLDHGELLGKNVPSAAQRAPGAQYLKWLGAGNRHDYLLASLGQGADTLNKMLVTGAAFDDPYHLSVANVVKV